MASVSTYLNLPGNTEEAFEFYRSVFGGDFSGPIHRMGGTVTVPPQDMFWGAYFGSLRDRFGVQWMPNCAPKA